MTKRLLGTVLSTNNPSVLSIAWEASYPKLVKEDEVFSWLKEMQDILHFLRMGAIWFESLRPLLFVFLAFSLIKLY